MPSPNVDSAVIRIKPDKYYRSMVDDKDLFFKVVRGAFSQRRKTMVNSLSSVLGVPESLLSECLEFCGIEKNIRAEQLSMEELILFANRLKNVI